MGSSFSRRRRPWPTADLGSHRDAAAGHHTGDVDGDVAGDVFVPVARLAALGTDLAERPLGPSLAFRISLRSQLLDEAAARTPAVPAPRSGSEHAPPSSALPSRPAPRSQPGKRVARRVTAAGLLLVVSGGGLTAAAASSSLPGDPLYGVKRLTESVRLHATHGSSPSADVQFVRHRLAEAERIAAPAGPDASASPGTRWADFDRAVGDARTALGRLQVAPASPDVVASLAAQRDRWQALLPVVPPESRRSVQGALDLVVSITGTLPAVRGSDPVGGDAAQLPEPEASDTPVGGARVPGAEPDADPAPPVTRSAAPSDGTSENGGSAPGLSLPDLGSATDEETDAGGTPGAGSGGADEQPRRLPLLPERGDFPTRSNTGNSSSWDGGPGVLERTADAVTQLLPPRDR
jgi:hypothetical protein